MRKREKNVLRYQERCCVRMNTIVVNDLSEIELSGCEEKMPQNFIFDKVKIIFDEYKCIVDSTIKKRKATYDDFEEVEYYFEMTINDLSDKHKVEIILTEEGYFCGITLIETTHQKDEKAMARSEYPSMTIMQICNYIMTTKRKRVQRKKTDSSIKSNYEIKRKENKPKKVYLLDEIVDYVNENGLTIQASSTHKIQCPCWSVRGHYRHYKNGNVVFIKSHEKGKEKGKTKPKDKVYVV